jgi:transcription elongation factor GreA
MSRVPLTVRGAHKLREELHHLKTVERPRVVAAIVEARAHGDLAENAEYHAAKEQQAFIEGRVAKIEAKLAKAQIIDIATLKPDGKIVFGAIIDLIDENTGDEITYQIVGEDEADIKQRLISVNSPIARALIGKEEGDIAVVDAPGGVKEYEIVGVRYE